MKSHLSKLCVVALTGLTLLLPHKALATPLVSETFEALNNGIIAGQPGWLLGSGGNTNLAQVVEDASKAFSTPKFLNLVGSNGSSANVARYFPTGKTLSDSSDNHLQFYFRTDNAQSGSKTHLYFTLHGNAGAGRIIEGFINFNTSRISLTTAAASNTFNTTVNLSATLETGKWYLFDAVLTPSDSTYLLNITDTTTSASLLSGQYSFQNTALEFDHLHGLQLSTNTNGRLDWQIDSLSVATAIPEPGTAALLLPVLAGSATLALRRKP